MATRQRKSEPATNIAAADRTIDGLRSGGKLETVDEAMIVGFRAIAAALDAEPSNASLWREYRAIEARLRDGGGVGDDLGRIINRLSAPIRD